jgi:hypothetical protein
MWSYYQPSHERKKTFGNMGCILTHKYSQLQMFLHSVRPVPDFFHHIMDKVTFPSFLMMSFMNGLHNKLITSLIISRKTGLIHSGRALMLGRYRHILLYGFMWVSLKHEK